MTVSTDQPETGQYPVHQPQEPEPPRPKGGFDLAALLRRRPEIILSPLLLVVILAVWEFGVRLRPDLEFLMARPSLMATSLVDSLGSRQLWVDIGTTGSEALTGFVGAFVLALVIGMLVVITPKVEEILVPFLIASYAVPVLVTAPLFVMWFGYGFESKAVIAGFTSFFPMLVNILNGFRVPDSDQVEMLESFTASRTQVFRLSRLPKAVPYVFTAMDVGLIFAMLGAIVGEFAGARQGLGYRVLQDSYGFAIADLFVTLLILAFLGFVAHAVVMYLQRRIAFWDRPTSTTI